MPQALGFMLHGYFSYFRVSPRHPPKVGIVPLLQKRDNLRPRSLLKATQFLTGRAGALLFIPVTNLAMTLAGSGLPHRVPVQGGLGR